MEANMSVSTAAICFIACHGGSADHFAVFAEKLVQEGRQVEVYATAPQIKKFEGLNIQVILPLNVEEPNLAADLAKKCASALVVISDVGHPFDESLQKAMAVEAPTVLRAAYYDNPEPYVPGGYSKVAAGVMKAAQKVLFANANLETTPLFEEPAVEIALPAEQRVGLGYYPLKQAEKTALRRAEQHLAMREEFFKKHELKDEGQKVLVYFGGNNEVYFQEAFPAFLNFLATGMEKTDLTNYVIVLQQHPAAKTKNIDREQFEMWTAEHSQIKNAPTMVVSEQTSDDMQVIADGALYYQTSMGPMFALAGIPMMQVGHKSYEDVIVRGGLCPSTTTSEAFIQAIATIKPEAVSDESRKKILASLGIKEEWFARLKEAITEKKEAPKSPQSSSKPIPDKS